MAVINSPVAVSRPFVRVFLARNCDGRGDVRRDVSDCNFAEGGAIIGDSAMILSDASETPPLSGG